MAYINIPSIILKCIFKGRVDIDESYIGRHFFSFTSGIV
jgi:hypothetical protein